MADRAESAESLAAEVRSLEQLGPRLTGSDTHRALVEQIAEQLASLGLKVHRDTHRFTRWDVPHDAAHLSLTVGEDPITIASAYPYSGTTGPRPVSGPLRLLEGRRKNWASARGGIAVVSVPSASVPYDLLIGEWDGPAPQQSVTHPVLSATLFGPKLAAAKAAGVLAVIAVWRGLSPENAAGQYVPFTLPYCDLPAVWVAGDSGRRVLDAARAGHSAELVLDATLTPDCAIDTIWAVSEGRSEDETLLVVTHTDGTNAVEENGHIGLLALARDAVSRPHRRKIVFVCTAAHLRIPAVTAKGQATTAWLRAHPELWAGGPGQASAVAALAIEHLGAREFVEDPATGQYHASGKLEPEILYATTRELKHMLDEEWAGPAPNKAHVSAPGPLLHFGEGEPMYEQRIPGISLVPAPQYILAEREGDLVDIDMMRRQIDSFLRLQRRLDAVADPKSLGIVSHPSMPSKLRAGARVAYLAIKYGRS